MGGCHPPLILITSASDLAGAQTPCPWLLQIPRAHHPEVQPQQAPAEGAVPRDGPLRVLTALPFPANLFSGSSPSVKITPPPEWEMLTFLKYHYEQLWLQFFCYTSRFARAPERG